LRLGEVKDKINRIFFGKVEMVIIKMRKRHFKARVEYGNIALARGRRGIWGPRLKEFHGGGGG